MREDQFLAIYHEHVTALFAFVVRRVGDERALAEDVVQEAWLRAVRAWVAEGPPASPRSWLCTVTHNLIRNHFRRAPLETLTSADLESCLEATGDPEPGIARILAHGLACLRPAQAALLEAFHVEGRDARSIAVEHGLSERAVEGRLHRARRALRSHLAPLVDSHGAHS